MTTTRSETTTYVLLTIGDIREEDVIVTRRQAEREYRRHYLTPADLTEDLGSAETYSAQAILSALGY